MVGQLTMRGTRQLNLALRRPRQRPALCLTSNMNPNPQSLKTAPTYTGWLSKGSLALSHNTMIYQKGGVLVGLTPEPFQPKLCKVPSTGLTSAPTD